MGTWIMAHPYLFVFMVCYCVTVMACAFAEGMSGTGTYYIQTKEEE